MLYNKLIVLNNTVALKLVTTCQTWSWIWDTSSKIARNLRTLKVAPNIKLMKGKALKKHSLHEKTPDEISRCLLYLI